MRPIGGVCGDRDCRRGLQRRGICQSPHIAGELDVARLRCGRGKDAAKKVGQAIAKLALDRQIQEVAFNRNGFLYTGRIKALAEAAREAGLQF